MATQIDLFAHLAAGHEEAADSAALSFDSLPARGRPEREPPDPNGRGFYGYNIGLIACSKSKLSHPAPARELYTGSLFRKARAYCERMCSQWYVLSAKHGLVHPEQVLEPYEQTLATAGAAERGAWGSRVLSQFKERPGSHVILAGRAYWESLPPEFFTLGTHSLPLKGCAGMGEQQARLASLVAQWDAWKKSTGTG